MGASNGEITTAPPPGAPLDTARLRRDGFARFRRSDLACGVADADLRRIHAAFADLPADPYAAASNRFRRYSQAVHLPWRDELSWIPDAPDPALGAVAEYWQDGYNAEYPGLRRRFPAIPAAVRGIGLLTDLIRANVAQVLWHDDLARTPIYVGVHLIKLSVDTPDQVAVSSPDCLHQDGGRSMFTFAHLVVNDNSVGGENVIAAPECAGRQPDEVAPADIRARFRLTEPLDGYAVHDHRVSHYVSPVRMGRRPATGARGVIIMGVAPMAPKI
jgi:hypothetical protein